MFFLFILFVFVYINESKHAFEVLWESHLDYEFNTKDANKTMNTMTDNPYVNHIPTMTGGFGKNKLYNFYNDEFIPNNPDMNMELISRTIGGSSLVDELVIKMNHDKVIPWLLPDIEPTNKDIMMSLVVIVQFKDNKIHNEHIYWDQASVLKQVGLIPDNIPAVYGGEQAQLVLDSMNINDGKQETHKEL